MLVFSELARLFLSEEKKPNFEEFGGLTIFAKVLPSPEQTSSVISFQELNDACRVLVKLVSVLDTLFVTLLVVLLHVLHSEETVIWELLFWVGTKVLS